MMGYDVSMNGNETRQKGEVRYCYDRQTWVIWNGESWTVDRCAHPRKMPGCYACENAGMTIGKGWEKIR